MKGFIVTGALVLIGVQQSKQETTTIMADQCTGKVAGGCIEDEYIKNNQQGLQCTSNDVKDVVLQSVVVSDGCDSTTNTATFSARVQYEPNAKSRYDIGLFIPTDNNFGIGTSGSDAYPFVGNCDIFSFACGGSAADDGNDCGDRVKNTVYLEEAITVTAPCIANPENGNFELPYCFGFDNSVKERECDISAEQLPIPQGPAKCSCGSVDVPEICVVNFAKAVTVTTTCVDGLLGISIPAADILVPDGFNFEFQVSEDLSGPIMDFQDYTKGTDIHFSAGFFPAGTTFTLTIRRKEDMNNPNISCEGQFTFTSLPCCPVLTIGTPVLLPNEFCAKDGTYFIVPIIGDAPAGSMYTFMQAGLPLAGGTLDASGNAVVFSIPNGGMTELVVTIGDCSVTLTFNPECDCLDVDGEPDTSQCDVDNGQICCRETSLCDHPDPSACGDPHMTGFLGQKFDFTGEDGGWYSLIADGNMNINMRVTSPVVDLPEITYITGLSVLTTDSEGFDHSIVIEVKDPHNLDSSCPAEESPCLADGSLRVVLDGEETLLAPGRVTLGQDVEISAANLPGACRSFGFEKYWERKQLENARYGRRLSEPISMGEWILGDPTATNMDECAEYVARAEVEEGALFAHQSEHTSFQIVTPKATIRLSHGRLHQIAVRDPTDQFDLPDHLTWQMNMAVDHNEVNRDAKGVLGETFVPTHDASGQPIMTGMEAIRGKQEDYRVEGALGRDFVQDAHTS